MISSDEVVSDPDGSVHPYLLGPRSFGLGPSWHRAVFHPEQQEMTR